MGRPTQTDHHSIFPQDSSEALEEMMDSYGSLVLRTAYFYLGDRHLAEDVSQEAFLRAFKNWQKFRGDSSVKTWLIKITINCCHDKRRKKSSKEQPVDTSEFDTPMTFNLEHEVMKKIDNTKVLKNLLRLSPNYQEVLYLYYYLDLSTSEIAKTTGTREGTVRTRLHRARSLIAELIREEDLKYEGSE